MPQNPKKMLAQFARSNENGARKFALIVSRKDATIGMCGSNGKGKPVETAVLEYAIVPKQIPFSTIYVLSCSDKNITNAKPSEKSIAILRENGVAKIVYSTEDGWKEINLLPINKG